MHRNEFDLSDSEEDTHPDIPPGVPAFASSCLRDGFYFFQRMIFSPPSTQIQLLGRHREASYHLGIVLTIRYKRECPQPADDGGPVPLTRRYYEYTPTRSEYVNPSAGWWVSAETESMFSSYRLLSFRRPDWIYVLWDEWRLQQWGLIRA